MWKVKRTLVALTALLAVPAHAIAGALNIDSRRPFVFNKAAVNIVVLPYSYAADLPRIDQTSKQLSLLTQLDVLFGIVKFGSVGAVQHVHVVTTPEAVAQCAPDVVVDKMMGRIPGADAQVENGQGLVVLWGRFYEERGSIFVQSYVRFLRRGVPSEGFTFAVDAQPIGGRVSNASFAFTPRLITRDDLLQINQRFTSTVKVHQSPDANSPTVDLALGSGRPFKYWIDDVRGNWMRLNAGGSGPEGWVQAADSSLEQWSLRRLLPELTFVEGVAGYLSTRVQRASPTALETRRTRAAAALQRALDVFSSAKSTVSPAPLPEVVGRQLLGLLALPAEASERQLDDAIKFFDAARERAPHDADARNLVATARLYRGLRFSAPLEKPEGYIDEYLAIVALDPRNDPVLRNVESLLELMSREIDGAKKLFGTTTLPAADVQKRLAAVRAIRKSLAAPGEGL